MQVLLAAVIVLVSSIEREVGGAQNIYMSIFRTVVGARCWRPALQYCLFSMVYRHI